jgi:hypothetical protein
MAIFKNIFGAGDAPEDKETDEFYETTRETFAQENGVGGSKMMLLEPRAFSESQQIADYLKKRIGVIVKLQRVTPDQARRITDFLSGCIYSINGSIQKLGNGIILCTPNNVEVEGKMSEEADKINKKKSGEDDFF